jgi:hypothetical protein
LPAREPELGNSGLDANHTFLCQYGGYTLGRGVSWKTSSSAVSNWNRAAVPVMGKGQMVSEIKIADKLTYSSQSDYKGISVAIYLSRKNKPFEKLAGARAKLGGPGPSASLCTSTAQFGAIEFQKGKKYWVVEQLNRLSASGGDSVTARVEWFYATTKKQKALSQFVSCTDDCRNQVSGSRVPITGGTPYVKLISNAKRNSGRSQTGRSLRDHGGVHSPQPESPDSTPIGSQSAGRRAPP